MDPQVTLVLHTLLNGLQNGLFLFLVAAGLTLVLGIMNLVNLAHGSLFMIGAYIAAWTFQQTGSFWAAIIVGLPATMLAGIILELVVIRWLYVRDHLLQVLATFGLILFFNKLVVEVFGTTSQEFNRPELLSGSVTLFGAPYPTYRLAIIAASLLMAAAVYLLVAKTRVGMWIRAGASNRTMAGALGINIPLLYTLVFGLGAVLAGFAGMLAGPVEDVFPGMGESKLILAFVVIVIGGIGSVRGAFIAAIIIGLVDVIGRTFMVDIMRWFVEEEFAQTAGPAIASMLIYILMAGVLVFRPQGLFPARSG